MTRICQELRAAVAADGFGALQHDEAKQRHLAECPGCFAFLETFAELDTTLRGMPSADAPDHVVEALLARPELTRPGGGPAEAEPEQHSRGRWLERGAGLRRLIRSRPLLWGCATAGTVVLVLSVSLFLRDRPISEMQRPVRRLPSEVATASKPPDTPSGGLRDPATDEDAASARGRHAGTYRQNMPGEAGQGVAASPPPSPEPNAGLLAQRQELEFWDRLARAPLVSPAPGSGEELRGSEHRRSESLVNKLGGLIVTEGAPGRGGGRDTSQIAEVPAASPQRSVSENLVPSAEPPVSAYGNRRGKDREARTAFGRQDDARAQRLFETPEGESSNAAAGAKAEAEEQRKRRADERARGAKAEPKTEAPAKPEAQARVAVETEPKRAAARKTQPGKVSSARAQQFLSGRASLEGLTFSPAKGYWANTYVPGDPVLRLLEARLAGRDLASLATDGGISPKLHDASRQTTQPFDPPTRTALAVYLHTDRRGIREESRVLVQVGLKGTPRYGGRRPPMNLGVVLDLRGRVSTDTAAGVRALVSALTEARESGDRMRLVVAGRPGGVIVEPDNFRYGYLTVTMNRVLAGEALPASRSLGLVEAVALAIDRVAQADDPDAPVGSSAVILITGQSVGGNLDALAGLAHRSAVAGVPLSVVAVGPGVHVEEINRLALAGQGNRRLLERPSEAAALVDRELSAVGRVIARAVRLRIRLAPGVKLVDVLGSYPLDEARAERVREAEKSIDRRLARNLGIEADRGEDEEGIQIVIPSFYADDAHVVLLDVVVPGPGAVADVTVRFKDLVYLRNGVARAGLGLGRSEAAAGPLERNVFRNLLALRLSETLETAGQALGARDVRRAAAILQAFRELLTGLRQEVAGLGASPDLAADIAMLGEYESLLGTRITGQPAQLAHLSDSLRYAGLLKVLPRPLTN